MAKGFCTPPLAGYSTSEIDTGQTWIDGRKVYRRVFDLTGTNDTNLSISSTTWTNTNISVSDNAIDFPINVFGITKYTNNSKASYPLICNTENTYVQLLAARDNGSAYVRFLVMEYIKTS